MFHIFGKGISLSLVIEMLQVSHHNKLGYLYLLSAAIAHQALKGIGVKLTLMTA